MLVESLRAPLAVVLMDEFEGEEVGIGDDEALMFLDLVIVSIDRDCDDEDTIVLNRLE